MVRNVSLLLLFAFFVTGISVSHNPRVRTPVNIPDVPGYRTLKCDFHIHTVFSDGAVWPDVRSEEAWREGLDAIAITDHIEYQPHKEDLPTSHERSYEIARPRGEVLRVTVIKGSEITREMPPGHINAIFLDAITPLDVEDWRDAIAGANDQGGFVFWNHPGWTGQQPDGVARWYPEHTELVEEGLLHGIEVANAREYYEEAHRWCLEKGLTMMSNSDVHNPIHLDYYVHDGDHRPLTLVFARENSAESIREALFERRTAVYTGNLLIGEERFVRPIFEASVEVLNPVVTIPGDNLRYLQIQNRSDIDYELSRGSAGSELVSVPEELVLEGGKTVLLPLRGRQEDRTARETVTLSFLVENVLLAPGEGMPIEIPVEIEFVP